MLRTTQNHQAGFMLAPLLYMLALGGIGAAVMFSGYSQVLRSNAEMTSVNAVRQQLSTAAQTLSASSQLTSGNTILTPPGVTTFAAVTDTARLPTSYATVNATGTPTSYGVLDTATGVRQLDPWGKYYLYCKWDSAIATGTNPSISIISTGPDGTLQTKCGDNAAVGDDRINKLSVAEAVNRANVWQVNSSSQVQFGNTGSAVKVDSTGNMNVDSMAVGPSATATSGNIVATGNVRGATMTSTGALSAGSASVTGALSAGATTVGTLSAGAATVSSVTSSGAISGGATTVSSLTSSGGVSAGGTISSSTNITANSTISAVGTISSSTSVTSNGTIAAVGTLSSVTAITSGGTITATGAASFGSLTLGTPLAILQGGTGANSAVNARTNLGLGTMATQNSNLVTITGGTISGVTFSGTISGGTYTGSVPFSSITSFPGGTTTYLRADGTWQSVGLSGGSTNYIPLWNSASTLTTSALYQSGSSIGIGTTGPSYLLHVNGSVSGNYVAGFINSGTHGAVGSGTTNGLVGYATSAGGFGVTGHNTANNAYGYLGAGSNGVSGTTNTVSSHGVVGVNSAAGSAGYLGSGYSGVVGAAASLGHGVVGQGYGSGSSSYGVYAYNGSTNAGLARADGYSYVGTGTLYNNGAITQVGGATNSFSGQINTTNNIIMNNGSPTLYLQDTDQLSAMVHNNSNLVYILRGCGANSTSWCTVNGWWPVYWNLTNNDMVSGGNIYAFNFYHNSDERLKKDIKPLQNSLDTISKLKGVSYTWKSNGDKSLGLIAQDVEKVLPMIVKETKEGFKSVDYEALIGPLVEAVKELKTSNDTLRKEFEVYKAAHP